MRIIEYRNHLTTKKQLFVSITQGTLVDIETTGLDENKDEIISVGFISGSQLFVIQRKTKDKEKFYDELRRIINKLPKPFYAFNIKFEEKFLRVQLGLKIKGKDLQTPWQALANSKGIKWPKLDELVSEPEIYFKNDRISGKDIPSLWKAFLMNRDEKLLELIMKHNQSDLLRELYLLVQYNYLYELEKE